MRIASATPTSDFLAAATGNLMTVFGPLPAAQATAVAVDRAVARARGQRVAVPVADPLLEALELRASLAASGASMLQADDPDWRAEIGRAGVGVTGARGGIAATGTLLLACGVGCPRGTHIIPPAHVCLVRASDLVATIADAVRITARIPHPTNMSWVSGPSRTADLEMQLTIGVHGPKDVEVIVVDP